MITITPYGAAADVTGSAYLVETENANVLVDFGMFQGDKDDEARNVIPGRIHRMKIDAVVLTHAHLDHCGRLPLLVREGYRSAIRATAATKDLAGIILRDAAHIQESDYERRMRHARKRGSKVSRSDEPLFDTEDVDRTMNLFRDVGYNHTTNIATGVTAVFREAGHMLGSTSVELYVGEKKIVFSGDLGPPNLPFLKDPDPPTSADVVFLESTYGDRDHKSLTATLDEFADVLNIAIKVRGKVFIPSFAIGRSQQILFHLAEFIREGRIPRIPIFLDSPMAISASLVYDRHTKLYDTESSRLSESKQWDADLESLRYCETADESRAINDMEGPFVVIAGAGMCNAGRILHHLRKNIDDPTAHIVMVGYQSRGSLGRYLVDGAENVTIMGDHKQVRARIHTLGGFSAHAGQTDLLTWLAPMIHSHPQIFLTHGEDNARIALQGQINDRFRTLAHLPVYAEHLMIA